MKARERKGRKPMNPDLIKEAEKYGINASLYYLLPPHKRESALRKDIERAKKQSAPGDE